MKNCDCGNENNEFIEHVENDGLVTIQDSKQVDTKSLIFDFCYENALRDATVRSAFRGKIQDIRNMYELKRIVKEYIYVLLDPLKCAPSPTKILIAMQQVEELETYNSMQNPESRKFRFGNLQKLLNMTIKYIYPSCIDDIKKRSMFNECHCPIDRQVLDKLMECFKEKQLDESKWNDEMKKYKIPRRSVLTMLNNICFSSITPEEYRICQTMISDVVNLKCFNNAIEFDYWAWKPGDK